MAPTAKKSTTKKNATKKSPAKKAVAKKPAAKKAVAKKAPAKKAPAKKAPAKKAVAKKAAVKKPAAKKAPAKKTVVKKPVAKKTAAKKTVAKKAPAKKPVAKKTIAKKAPVKKAPAKTTTKKAPVKKTVVAKTPAKKSPVKKTAAKKAVLAKAPEKPAPKKIVSKAPKGKAAVAVMKEDELLEDERPIRKKAEDALKNAEKHEGAGFMGIPPYKLKKNEEFMNDEQKAHFRQILTVWKQSLLDEASRTVNYLQDEVSNHADPNDRATQEEEFSLELRTRDRERRLIKKIEQALQKLNEDDYGYCDMCGVEIGVRRLEARPTANLCIDCKTTSEIREKQGVF